MKAFRGALVSVVLVLALGTVAFAADLKVRVIASQANIRLKPDFQSAVISKVPLGGVLDVMQKEGDWYQIKLPPDEKGFVVTGYIHGSTVEVIEETKPIAKEERVEETKSREADLVLKMTEKEIIEEQKRAIKQPAQPTRAESRKKYAFRAGLGLSFPSGDMAELFGLGIGLSAGNSLSIIRQPAFDFDLIASLEAHIFFRKAGYTDISWTRMLLSGDGRFSFKVDPVSIFAQGGVAIYYDILEISNWLWTEGASKFRFGPKIGGGIGFKNLEFMAMYHLVEDKMFSVLSSIIIKF
jgi:opacity protein-like surface antigen